MRNPPYIHGTFKGSTGKYRYNTSTKRCEFVLWEAGEQGHKSPYWHVMGIGWESAFIVGYPTEQQVADRLEF